MLINEYKTDIQSNSQAVAAANQIT